MVIWMLGEHSILEFCKHYESVTFEYSLNILNQRVTFKKKNIRKVSNWNASELFLFTNNVFVLPFWEQ